MANLRGKLEVAEVFSVSQCENIGWYWLLCGGASRASFGAEQIAPPWADTEQAALAAGRAWAEEHGIELED